ncbi:MAG: mechanosensitive ion channel domain-containing protein [Myxococcota bacterium]
MSTTEYLIGAIGDLTAWVLGGLVLFWLLRLLAFLLEMSPLPPRLRTSLLRFAPVVDLVVAVAYVASALVELMAAEPEFAWILIALVVTLVAFSWSALYDIVLGVVFRVARVCQVGDLVQVDEIDGRVLKVGARALVLQTRDGDEAVVPYGRIGRRTLRRTQSVSGAYVHSFVLEPPVGREFAELKQQVIEAAMRSHWASAVHQAKVERRAGGLVEVSIFSHDADHAPIVEQAVRESLIGKEVGDLGQVFDESTPAIEDPTTSEEPPADPTEPEQIAATEGIPTAPLNEETSDVMDLGTVLGPRIPPPPSWTAEPEPKPKKK